jgi:aminoglycoside phosphotransferase (APT) family kinase protein
MIDNMQQRLQAYYEAKYPNRERLLVADVVSVTGGLSHEMHAFNLEYGPSAIRQHEALMLRIYSGEGAQQSAELEFHGMRHLYEAEYPVPRVFNLERADSPVGAPFIIMERILGKALWQRVVDSPEDQRAVLHALFCQLLFRLHQLDWRRFAAGSAGTPMGSYAHADEHLAKVRMSLTRHSLAGLLPVVEWLQMRRDTVPCPRPVVMHGDFHYQNVLLRDDGSAAVIDWTTLQVADARMDLAWTLVLQETFVSKNLRDSVLREYERLAGTQIQQLDWFETLACLWRLRDALVVLRGGADSIGMHGEATNMMQQQREPIRKTYELLLKNTGIRVAEIEQLFASRAALTDSDTDSSLSSA